MYRIRTIRFQTLFRYCRILGFAAFTVIIATIIITKSTDYVPKELEISPGDKIVLALRNASHLKRNVSSNALDTLTPNISQNTRERYSLFPPRPTIANIPDVAFDIDLEEVRLESLDGKQIYDEVILYSSTRPPINTHQERANNLKVLLTERDTKSSTVRLSGYGEVPNCNVSYIAQQLGSAGSYTTARTCSAIFFTKVPGCGSGLFTELFSSLVASRVTSRRFIFMDEPPYSSDGNVMDTENLKLVVDVFESMQHPFVYARHIPYINFTHINSSAKEPLYISVLRDPWSRMVAEFMYYRSPRSPKPTMTFDECIASDLPECRLKTNVLSYFCGHQESCSNASRSVLARAKQTVSEKYLLVGVYQDVGTFTSLLRMFLPNFFIAAPSKLQAALTKRHTMDRAVMSTLGSLTDKTKSILRSRVTLSLEFEFYQFVQQRFYNIYQKITEKRNKSKPNHKVGTFARPRH